MSEVSKKSKKPGNRPRSAGGGSSTAPAGRRAAKRKSGDGEKKAPKLIVACFAILLGMVYLAVEFAFNAQLTWIAGSLAEQAEIEALESAGRMIAAAGAILLVWRLIDPKQSLYGTMLRLMLVIPVVGPAVYFGQKALIDGLIDAAGPEDRKAAMRTAFLRQSVAAGSFRIEGFPTDPQSADTRVFVALSGVLGHLHPGLLTDLNSNLEANARELLARTGTPEGAWNGYQIAVEQVRQSYARFRDASGQYQLAVNQSAEQAAQLWTRIVEDLERRWVAYDTGRNEVIQRGVTQSSALYGRLTLYFRAQIEGREVANQYLREYSAISEEIFGYEVDPQVWCDLSGCPGTERFVRAKISELAVTAFAERSNLPPNLTRDAFFLSGSISSEVRAAVAERGITLPEGWRLTGEGRDQLIAAATRDIPREAQRRFEQATLDWFGEVLPPNLTFEAFALRATLQSGLRRALNLPEQTRVPVDLTFAQFTDQLFPRIQRGAAERLAANMQAPFEDFVDGERLAEEGRNALRAVVVPPVAMTFSLFFGLSNALALLFEVFALFTGLAFRLTPGGGGMHARLNQGIRLARPVGVAVILVAPFMLSTGLARYDGYGVAIGAAFSNNAVMAVPVAWVMRVQPGVYPLGEAVRQGPMFGFSFVRDDAQALSEEERALEEVLAPETQE